MASEGAPIEKSAKSGSTSPSIDARVGLLPITLGQGFPDYFAEKLAEHIRKGWDRAKTPLGAVTVLDGSAASTCTRPECWRAYLAARALEHLVRAEVSRVGPDFRFQLEVVDAQRGVVAANVGGYCELCGIAELGDAMADQAAVLAARVAAPVDDSAHLVVDGSPRGSTVWVDGRKVGSLPLELEIEPGLHGVEVRHAGHSTQSREWTARAQIREHMRFELSQELWLTRRPAWGWLLTGLGLATAGAGGVLVGIDKKPHRASCDGLEDRAGNCPNRYRTMAAGISVLGTGAAVLGTGVGLLVYYYRRARKTRNLRTQAMMHATPGQLIWEGRF